MRNKIYIYGLCDVHYDAYYIEGIKKVYGNYRFNTSKFPELRQGAFAFIIENDQYSKKIIIDSTDKPDIELELLEWCDIYGKINYNQNYIPSGSPEKIIPIGPSFGIKIWSLFVTFYYMLFNFIKFRKAISNKREFLANYWRQYKRFPLKDYKPLKSSNNQVFFMNSIWKEEKNTNNYRALFIKTCKKFKEINFEGGFAARANGDNLGYDSLVYSQIIPLKIYLKKIKNSMVVFNTPAVLSCHGWKLGEFLALGKAIISTDHYNMMPEPLNNNEHLIYANNAEAIREAIQKVMSNVQFKNKLELQARAYFDEYLAPHSVIEKLTSL
ncbi:glycosyltransferase involved in cell wall biosynthesis [Flavobacterium nitrogenifigens]|uniref:Glycosyltransferase involved in cell wall biosynthesis n=2 Tax=Flavobacterium TaxID=237 RepID=A0A7W7IZV0_9FLAO|nr:MULTISPECIES: glycosyltransferase [Flavobacterium]MBB4803634.1 glycosyltransferase involved in cell wall biosynthesis [Flavobacterium nitrogenifigens]MBB6388561.1 glycosyltransferase involved in cell wall biosynthesis [Flavobacterium notoginsengisoli]